MSGLDSGFQKLITGTIAANGATLDITSPNSGTSTIQLTGTWVGTLVAEGSNDGTNYNLIAIVASSNYSFIKSMNVNGNYIIPTNGFQNLRIRSTAWTSGTVTINVWGSDAPSIVQVLGLKYEPTTYSAAVSFATAATPTDVFNIIGSSTKTIRVTKIRITGTTTSGSPISVSAALIKRSTANTGGTRVPATEVAHDSTSAASTADVGHYTANPSALGTSVGNIRTHRITFNQTGITGGDVIWEFTDAEPVILRGTSEQLCVNMRSTTVTGGNISISVEYQEI